MQKDRTVSALLQHARGEYAKHRYNAELLMDTSVSYERDHLEAIHDEVEQMAMWRDQIDIIESEWNT